MKILHHNDADGFGAAYIVKRQYENSKRDIKLYELDYNKILPLDEIEKDEQVFIVDFSLDPNDMLKLLNKTQNVTWIDHHKSAIERHNEWWNNLSMSSGLKDLAGVRLNGISGTGLTYLYFEEGVTQDYWNELLKVSLNEEEALDTLKQLLKNAPLWVRLVDDWDVWNLTMPESEQLQIAIANKLTIDLFEEMDNTPEKLDRLLTTGQSYLDYRKEWSNKFMDKYGFERDIVYDGQEYHCLVANLGNANSKFFGDNEDKYDMLITYCYNGDNYNYSLYSTKDNVDCSVIAKAMGGGGHKGAAGFSSKYDFENWCDNEI